MSKTTRIVLGLVLFSLQAWLFYSVWKAMQPTTGRTYDCSMAEFHPDYPAEVKRKCREIRSGVIT